MLVETFVGIATSQPHAENAVRRVKAGTSALLGQSGLSEEWWGESNGMLLLFGKHTGQNWHTESHRVKQRCGTPFDGPIIPF